MAIASGDEVTEDSTGRGMQRHQTRLAELGATDRQHSGLEIDILKLKIACLAEAETRNAEQTEQAVVDRTPRLTTFITGWHLVRSSQKAPDHLSLIQTAARCRGLKRQHTWRGT